MSRRLAHLCAWIGCVLMLAPQMAFGQFVRGIVRDRAGAPVAGVISTLLDSNATAVGNALSNDRGEFNLRVSRAGTYTLRSLRIGYSATVSPKFVVTAQGSVSREVVLDDARLQLQTIRVAAKSVCQTRADVATQTFALWEQARAAVAATNINANSKSMFATTLVYYRVMDGLSRRVKNQRVETRAGVVTQPWATISADSLSKIGYVVAASDTVAYYAPGLDVLSSDEFLERHCLRLAQSDDSTQIGIAFEPVSNKRGYSDITGTLWLDRATAELRQIDFGYTNIPDEQKRAAGGEIRFARMSNTNWAIARWSIRMPVLMRMGSAQSSRVVLAESHEVGGELALVTSAANARGDTLWVHPLMTMRGTVADSVSGKRVASATVSLLGTDLVATTNSDGEFSIPNVLPGVYTADVRSPVLSGLGAGSVSYVTFLSGENVVALRVATPAQILAGLCSQSRGLRENGAIVGTVSSTDESVSGVKIVAEWQAMTVQRTGGGATVNRSTRAIETRTDAAGSFRACGVSTGQPVTIRAIGTRVSSLPSEVVVPNDIGMWRQNLQLLSTASRNAVLAGTVSADSTNRIILNAEVLLPDLGLSTRVNAQGQFRIENIPPGTHKLVARSLGYSSLETELTFEANQTEERPIRLSRVTVLDSVTTTASADTRLSSFEENKKMGLGQFYSRADLEKFRGQPMQTFVRQLSGVTVLRATRSSETWAATSRGAKSLSVSRTSGGPSSFVPAPEDTLRGAKVACYTSVWVDGQQVYRGRNQEPLFDLSSIRPDEIEAFEYYRGASETPSKYATLNSACGVMVIWTRR